MENLATVIIEGKRIILKPIALKYLELIFQEFTSEITRFVYSKPANHISETQDFINQAINKTEKKTQGYFILISQRINSLSYTLSPFKRT